MFRDATMGQRLSVGFGAVILVLALVVAFIDRQVEQTNRLAVSVTNDLSPLVKAAGNLAIAVDRQGSSLRAYVLSGNQKYLTDYQTALSQEKLAMAVLTPALKGVGDSTTLAHVQSTLKELRFDEARTLELLRSGDKNAALNYHAKHLTPLVVSMASDAGRMVTEGLARIRSAARDFETSGSNLRRTITVAFACALLLSIIFGVAVVRSVSLPAKRLAKIATEVASADYARVDTLRNHLSKVGSTDPPRSEIGRLEHSIVSMAASLRVRERALAAHGAIASICVSSSTLDMLMERTLEELARQTESGALAAFTFRGKEPLRWTYGISSENAEAAFARPGGVVEKSVASGNTVLVTDIPDDIGFALSADLGNAIPRAIACFPLRMEGDTVGAIALASLHGYDTTVLEMVEASASEIALAVGNALHHLSVKDLAEDLSVANEQLDSQNEELHNQNEEIHAQNEELESQAAELRVRNRDLEVISKSLVREQTRLRAIIQTVPDGVVMISAPDGRVTVANQAAMALYGLDTVPDVPIGEHAAAFGVYGLDGKLLSIEDLPLARCFLKGEASLHAEIMIRRPDASSVIARCNCAPKLDENGEISGAVAVFSDITDLKAHQSLLQEIYEKQRGIAEILQKSFLPSALPDVPGYEIAEAYIGAQEHAQVGGDFYDFVDFGEGRFGLVIGDVSGKGVGAAVHTAMAKYMLRGFSHEDPEPQRVMKRLNDAMTWSGNGELFITLFYGILDTRQGRLVYASAGHERPLIYRSSTADCVSLDSTGPVLGILAEASYTQRETVVSEGDALVLYTDGITEARRSGEILAQEGLESIIKQIGAKSASEMVDEIISRAKSFADGTLSDDVALLVIKSLPV